MSLLYSWPVERAVLQGVSTEASPVHRAMPNLKHAVDFMVPLESRVLAMADGLVTSMEDDSEVGGELGLGCRPEDSIYYDSGNRIEIMHEHDRYTAYEHILPKSSLVKVGDRVNRNQLIALTGHTGLMADIGPHLHTELFSCWGKEEDEFETIKFPWEDKEELMNYLLDRQQWMKKKNQI